jgi:hypothetical protein
MRRLSVKRLTSIGAVEEGDNPPAEIFLFKRRTPKLLPDTPEVSKVTNKIPDRANHQRITDMGIPDLSTLDEDVRAEIEKALEEANDRIAELEADIASNGDGDGDGDPVLKGLPDEAVAKFEALEKQAADTAAALAKERDERLTVVWVGKARAFERTIGDAEEAAPHFKAMPTETSDWLLEKLTKIEAVLEKSDLFKEVGKNDEASAAEQIDALAVEKRKENPELTDAQARVLVRKENPDLRAAEKEEGK